MKKTICSLLLLAITFSFSGCLSQCCDYQHGGNAVEKERGNAVLYDVVRVVDGDTLVVNVDGTETTIRLIGVDTPESVNPDIKKNTPYGKVAFEFTENLLKGKKVSLEYDSKLTDDFGRTLAYVFLDDLMVNEILLAEGHGKTLTIPPNIKHASSFYKIQKEAQGNKKGLWEEQ